MSKLTEMEKLKYWLDTEVTIIHVLIAVVLFQVTTGWVWNIILTLYVIYSIIYILTRLAVIAADDPNYLRAPKR